MAEADPLRWKALTIVCAAFFMTVLDVSIVNVALPSIGKSLHFSRESLQWVITAYAITFGGFLLLGGRAADLLGRASVFLVGVLVFTAASFLCGLAWSEGVLIARARRPGPRRRDHHACRALDHHDDVRRRRRAKQGARHLGRDRRRRRGGRRARRRRADQVPGLGVDLLRQRPGRRDRVRARTAVRPREPPRARVHAGHRRARSRSPPVSRCSSTRSRSARTTAGGRAGRSPARRRGRCC